METTALLRAQEKECARRGVELRSAERERARAEDESGRLKDELSRKEGELFERVPAGVSRVG